MSEYVNPFDYIRKCIGDSGRVQYMPNGGNLGDNLIAAATIQRFAKEGIRWTFMRGGRENIREGDLLVYGGGGSLVPLYKGGIACVKFLQSLGKPVVVLPHTVRGHDDFWGNSVDTTVFCRDGESLKHMRNFPRIQSFLSHDVATSIDLEEDPFRGISALRKWYQASGADMRLLALRKDDEAVKTHNSSSLDLSEIVFPPINSVESIYANAAVFLSALTPYETVETDRLHVAIGSAVQGINVILRDNSYGKNGAIFSNTLQKKFPNVRFIG